MSDGYGGGITSSTSRNSSSSWSSSSSYNYTYSYNSSSSSNSASTPSLSPDTSSSSVTGSPPPPSDLTYEQPPPPGTTGTGTSSPSPSPSSSPSPSPPGISGVAIAITATGSVVGIVMLITISILAFKCLKKKMRTSEGEVALLDSAKTEDSNIQLGPIDKFINEFSKEKPMKFTPEDLKVFTGNYVEPLGSGGFGDVFKGRLPNELPVAVKVLKEISSKIVNDQFAAELGTVGRTNHINLVRLYGYCFDEKLKALIYEYMENGSLQSCLDEKYNKLEWGKLHEIALGTAKGIRYLHEECKDMIIHYDIKPANVLLGKNFSPKVSDFGMAELWDRESTLLTVTQGRGTPGFVAPELVVPLSATNKCDVYSFGMLLFEILGSRVKMQEGKLDDCNKWVREKAVKGEFQSILSSCGVQDKEKTKVERMCKVALVCVQLQPEARPAMNSVVRMLEGVQEIGSPVSVTNRVASTGADQKTNDVKE